MADLKQSNAITIIIPTLNAGELFDGVLTCIEQQETTFSYEILAVDSGSTDGTIEVLERHDVRLVQIEEADFNHGTTRNAAALEHCSSPLVAFLSQDATPCGKRWLRDLVEAMEDLAVAGCFATQVPREGAHPFQCVNADRHHKAGGDDDIKAALTVEEFESLAPLARLNHIGFDNVSSVIRRSVLESHPFAHCPFGEDIRWARHVILRGYAVAQSGTAQVLHSHDVNQVEFRNRAQQTHQLWRELTDYEPFPHLGWWLRRTAGQIVRLIRAALSDPTRSWGARVAIALTAPYWGWIQMRANYRGSRRGTYDPPSASR